MVGLMKMENILKINFEGATMRLLKIDGIAKIYCLL